MLSNNSMRSIRSWVVRNLKGYTNKMQYDTHLKFETRLMGSTPHYTFNVRNVINYRTTTSSSMGTPTFCHTTTMGSLVPPMKGSSLLTMLPCYLPATELFDRPEERQVQPVPGAAPLIHYCYHFILLVLRLMLFPHQNGIQTSPLYHTQMNPCTCRLPKSAGKELVSQVFYCSDHL
jgi:hypothetical protein